MQDRRVLIFHPRTVLTSSGVPSPSSFWILVILARDRGVESLDGRNTVWTARGVVFFPLHPIGIIGYDGDYIINLSVNNRPVEWYWDK